MMSESSRWARRRSRGASPRSAISISAFAPGELEGPLEVVERAVAAREAQRPPRASRRRGGCTRASCCRCGGSSISAESAMAGSSVAPTVPAGRRPTSPKRRRAPSVSAPSEKPLARALVRRGAGRQPRSTIMCRTQPDALPVPGRRWNRSACSSGRYSLSTKSLLNAGWRRSVASSPRTTSA